MNSHDALIGDLETAGIELVVGRLVGEVRADDIEVRLTKTGASHDGASDVNTIVKPERAHFYVRRSGQVWMMAAGPSGAQDNAIVYVAAHTDDSVTDEQRDVLAALSAVLRVAYGLDGSPDQADDEHDPEYGE